MVRALVPVRRVMCVSVFRSPARRLAVVPAALLPLIVGGCAGLPWAREGAAPAVPGALHCEDPASATERSLPVTWQQDTMVIDLRGLAGSGECSMRPGRAAGWPERIALRVTPGLAPALEVIADQRLRWPATEGAVGDAVDLMLPHALHSPTTPAIRLRWGAGVAVTGLSAP